MTRRRHLTASGRFEVVRAESGCLELRHVTSGLRCGGFSHLEVKTFKHAIAGVERAESRMPDIAWSRIAPPRGRESQVDADRARFLAAWRDSLEREFPNGAWSRM